MWFGGDWPDYDQTVIRVYVDGEEHPSIEMELGLGHGVGFGEKAAPWGSEKMGHPSGFYNTYKIPFGKSIRVTGQRPRHSPDGAPFWWIIRGTENLPVTLAGLRLPESARLKLHKLSLLFIAIFVLILAQFPGCRFSHGAAKASGTMRVAWKWAQRLNWGFPSASLCSTSATPVISSLPVKFINVRTLNTPWKFPEASNILQKGRGVLVPTHMDPGLMAGAGKGLRSPISTKGYSVRHRGATCRRKS